MLPRLAMLATTKWMRVRCSAAMMAGLVLIQGCTPAGPRALLEGENLLRSRKYPQAINKLRVATELMPGDGRAWNYYGLACHYGGQTPTAIRAYQRALLCRPVPPSAWYNLGCLYLDLNNLPAALEPLMTYVQLEPKSAPGWLRLGIAQLRSRQYPLAETSLNKALQVNAGLAEAWNGLGLIRCSRGQYRDATNYFSAALRYAPDYPAALLNMAVVQHQHLKNKALALQHYRDYLAGAGNAENLEEVQQIVAQLDQELTPPNLIVAQSNAPSSAVAQVAPPVPAPAAQVPPSIHQTSPTPASQKPAAATAPTPSTDAIATAMVAYPRPIGPGLNEFVPVLAAAATNPPPATPRKVEVAAIRPKTVVTDDPRVDRGPTRSTDPTPAKPMVDPSREPVDRPERTTETDRDTKTPKTPSVFPFQPPVLSGSGRYPYQKTLILPSGDRDEAEKAFRSGVQEQRAGRVTAAIRAYRQAVQADPSYFEALYNLGAMAYQAGDLNLSVYAYERALVAHPVSAAARYNFALALRRANYLEDAAAELERVLNVAPNDTQARLVLANLYAQQLNQPLLARQHYEKILSLDPSHPQSTEIRNWLAGFR